jgi:hypothetical protein
MSQDVFDDSEAWDQLVDNSESLKDTSTKDQKSGRSSGKRSGAATGAVARQPRIPMHVRQTATAPERPGFVRRIFNHDPTNPGRIERAKMAGWTGVSDTSRIGDEKTGVASQFGSVVTRPMGKGVTGVLMEIPEELYKEDQAAKARLCDEREKAMLESALRNSQSD